MSTDLEQRIRQTGLDLYRLIEDEKPSVFNKQFWTGKVLEWCMHNEAFKVEMFRFVDVFPSLANPVSVARHLQEYFCRPGQDFPAALQLGIRNVAPHSLAAKAIARTIASNISALGKQFIAGTDAQNALPLLTGLRSRGLAFTADLLGEAVLSEQEAESFVRRYRELLEILDSAQQQWPSLGNSSNNLDWGHAPKINISIKPSALYSQMNPRSFDHSISMAKERLRPVLRIARKLGAFVLLDMEHTQLKNLTLALYRSLMEEPEFRGYEHTGCVIQSYLKDSEQDLRDLIAWADKQGHPATIRLVKGAYWDAETVWAQQNNWPLPVFSSKSATDANFEKLSRMLLQNHETMRCACASHNIRSIACVMETARELRLPDNRVEYQVLYGMAEPVVHALQRSGLQVRLYTPVGALIPGMAYLVRRLLENTSNESFLRKSFAQEAGPEELLRNPNELLSNSPGIVSPGNSPEVPRFHNEPPLDWALSENRGLFATALLNVKNKLPFTVPLYVNKTHIKTNLEFCSRDPNLPERVVGNVSSAGLEEIQQAISAAGAAFSGWRDTAPDTRAQYLLRAAKFTRKKRFELAALEVYEAGKNWSEADADVCEAIDFLEYYGREMLRWGNPRCMGDVPGETSHLLYEPRGIGAVIAPWNFPLAISMGMIAAAMVTGNTVVYKPSSLSPVTGSMIYTVFTEAGVPPGVLNYVPGAGAEIGDYLVSHPDVSFIAFTGSRDVGLRIIKLAGATAYAAAGVKHVIAEMGGKNAIIVDTDADLDEAVLHSIQSAFSYQGQKCSACSRLIVMEDNYERLMERLTAAAESITMGPVEDPRNFMGAVIDENARQKIERYAVIGKQEGTLVLERDVPGNSGCCTALRIFTNIRPEHRLAQEEIFGPLLSVMKVKDFDEALRVANSTPYALTGALFSRSPLHIERCRREFRVGNLYINRGCTGAIVGRHPFGGFKMSGVGAKAGGPDYLLQFMIARSVAENTMRRGFAPSEYTA